jgi:hypothetical protein
MKIFDWNKAYDIINKQLETDKSIIVIAAFKDEFFFSSGVIYNNGYDEDFPYGKQLKSEWDIPMIIITDSQNIETREECWIEYYEGCPEGWKDLNKNITANE